jgi:hypothetical protein
VTGFVIAAPRVAFSVRRVLCAPLRFDALFVVLRLRDTFARFEAVFLARDAVLAAVGPRALPPPTLARDLDAVVFADVPLRVAAVLTTVFLEAAVLFFLGFDVLLAGPRVLIPAPDLEAVGPTCGSPRVSSRNQKRGQRHEFPAVVMMQGSAPTRQRRDPSCSSIGQQPEG